VYETFFRLRGTPFSLTPDTRFFFPSGGHNRALAYLRFGLHKREGFIVITGDVGAGKTTLIDMLLEDLARQRDMVAAKLIMTQWDADQLLPMVAAAFGVSDQGISSAMLLQRLVQFLTERTHAGRRAILIVDEVQNLSMRALEVLRLLANYQVDHKAILQGFLVGQASFSRLLAQTASLEPLRQRITTSYHLGAMSFDETRRYIEHRLSVVAWRSDPEFKPDSYKTIFTYTGGIPRRINSLCDRVLLVAYLEDKHAITQELVNTVIAELDAESFRTTIEAHSATKTRTGSVESPETPRDFAESEFENRACIVDRLFRLEERVSAVEKVIGHSAHQEEPLTFSREQEVEELRAQLAQARADNERLKQKLAVKEAEAEEDHQTLEEETANLLYRLMPNHDNAAPWPPK
jgi:general secretion pathway protein A